MVCKKCSNYIYFCELYFLISLNKCCSEVLVYKYKIAEKETEGKSINWKAKQINNVQIIQ